MGNVQKLNFRYKVPLFVCERISSLVPKHHGNICTRSLAPLTISATLPFFLHVNHAMKDIP